MKRRATVGGSSSSGKNAAQPANFYNRGGEGTGGEGSRQGGERRGRGAVVVARGRGEREGEGEEGEGREGECYARGERGRRQLGLGGGWR